MVLFDVDVIKGGSLIAVNKSKQINGHFIESQCCIISSFSGRFKCYEYMPIDIWSICRLIFGPYLQTDMYIYLTNSFVVKNKSKNEQNKTTIANKTLKKI